MAEKITNWAGNYEYRAARLHEPASVEHVQELVARADGVKVLGTRHSFNDVADTAGDHLSLQRLAGVVALDADPRRPTVTVEGGITYGPLCRHLHREGYALPNLASLPHISVAGACATATHGSGDGNAILAAAVSAIDVVTADGRPRQFSRERDAETFAGMVVGLGAIGVVVRLTLDLVPAFDTTQEVYENLPLDGVVEQFDALVGSAYSVSLFTDWRGGGFNQAWFKRRVTDGQSRFDPATLGATLAARPTHPIAGLPAEHCTEQGGVPGPWHERLPHFRMDFTPSSGEELQSEYFVPRPRAASALRAIDALRDRVAPLLQISEVRTIAADDLWMSPCYRQACVALHFTWKKDRPAVAALLPVIEERLAPFHARPHWGKLFTTGRHPLASLYPKMADFRRLLQSLDPAGKFGNAFLERTFLEEVRPCLDWRQGALAGASIRCSRHVRS